MQILRVANNNWLGKVNTVVHKKKMNICIYTVRLFLQKCVTCKLKIFSCLFIFKTLYYSYISFYCSTMTRIFSWNISTKTQMYLYSTDVAAAVQGCDDLPCSIMVVIVLSCKYTLYSSPNLIGWDCDSYYIQNSSLMWKRN